MFTITAQADFGVSATILDSEKVQIWPIATGRIRASNYQLDMPEYPKTVSFFGQQARVKTVTPTGTA